MNLSFSTPQSPFESRALGCMAGLATGNVLGLAVESHSRDGARKRLGNKGPLRRLPTEERNRDWDDDFAMVMALSGCLIALPEGALHLDTSDLRAAYLGWLQSGSRGVGGLTQEVLIKTLSGELRAAEWVWKQRCKLGSRPLGNGAAMRIAPLGLAFAGDPARIAELAAEDAALTHWDPISRQTAAAIAVLTAALVRGESAPFAFTRAHLGIIEAEVAEALVPVSIKTLEIRGLDLPDMGSALLALKVAVSVLQDGMPYAKALPWLLREGGDTDTNGAIVGALLGARDGTAAIPPEWLACVHQVDRILETGWKLLQRSGLLAIRDVP